jgi:hypothetical protein
MTEATDLLPANFVPDAYRAVAVADVDCDLTETALTSHLVGRDAYRRSRFIVVRRQRHTAVVAIEKEASQPLFSPITSLRLLAGPDDCAFVHRPDLDTAIPTHLARAALEDAPGARGVVVEGSYGHISFIVNPSPLLVTVREVVPPTPPKLYHQVQRLLEVADQLPPIRLASEVVDLSHLAHSHPTDEYLLPCRGGGITVAGAHTSYLDQHPARRSWTLIGCERSQQIHEWFFGDRAPQVDMCPRKAADRSRGAVLTKCCLFEDQILVEDRQVVVPWGASLAQVSEALAVLAERWEPSWAPG